MANLESAADELVLKLTAVDAEVEEAQERLTAVAEQVRALIGEVETEWGGLEQAVTDLVEAAGEEAAALGGEVQESLQAVGTLDGVARNAQQAADGGLETAENGTRALADGVRERAPAVDEIATASAQRLEALGEQAAEMTTALDQVLQEGQEFLEDEVAATLAAVTLEVQERFAEMRTTLTEECTTGLQGAYDEWSDRLDEILESIESQGFEAAHENAKEVAEWALTECATKHEEELTELVALADTLQQALRTLQDDLGECVTDVGEEGRSALDNGVGETQQALAEAQDALDSCRQVLAGYTFVKL